MEKAHRSFAIHFKAYWLLSLLSLILLAGCEKEVPQPAPPEGLKWVKLYLEVEDSYSGGDLLDRTQKGHWVSEYIRLIVEGENYYIKGAEDGFPDWEEFYPEPEVKRYDLRWIRPTENRRGRISISGFGEPKKPKTSFVIDWHNGRQDTFQIEVTREGEEVKVVLFEHNGEPYEVEEVWGGVLFTLAGE